MAVAICQERGHLPLGTFDRNLGKLEGLKSSDLECHYNRE